MNKTRKIALFIALVIFCFAGLIYGKNVHASDVSASSSADLIVKSITLTPQKAEYLKSDSFVATFVFQNIGNQASGIYSFKVVNKTNNWPLMNLSGYPSLTPGQEYSTSTVTIAGGLPWAIIGLNELEVTVDSANEVVESNEQNNALIKTLNVVNQLSKPDLIIADLQYYAPGIINPVLGNYVGYKATIKNIGSTPAKGQIKIIGYFNGQQFRWEQYDSTFTIQPGASVIDQQYAYTKFNKMGANTIMVKVDANNVVNESNESNNAGNVIVNIGAPDLVISDIQYYAPNVANPVVGDYVGYKVTIKNIGNAPAKCPATMSGHLNGQFLRSETCSSSVVIQPGETFADQQYSFTTFSAVGTSTIMVKVDTNNNIIESNENNNTASVMVYVGEKIIPKPDLKVSRNSTPISQMVIAGQQQVVLGSWIFDARDSEEDIKITRLDIAHMASESNINDLVPFIDEGTLTNVIEGGFNPVAPFMSTSTFTFFDNLIIQKGSFKIVSISGNIKSSGVYPRQDRHGITSAASVTAVGVTTNQNVAATVTPDDGATFTIDTGILNIALDSSSPSASLKSAGSTGVTVGTFKLTAQNEDVNIKKIRVYWSGDDKVGNPGGAKDIGVIRLYDGATQIGSGSVVLPGFDYVDIADPINYSLLSVPKDSSKVITIKVDFANINNGTGTAGNSLVFGLGGKSGIIGTFGSVSYQPATLNYTSSTSSPIVIYKSVPTIAKRILPSSTLANTDMSIYRFSITADAKGDIALYKTSFKVATSGVGVSNAYLYDVNNSQKWSANTPVTIKNINEAFIDVILNDQTASSTYEGAKIIMAGQTIIFDLYATITYASAGDVLITKMLGDSAKGIIMAKANDLNASSNFIWGDEHVMATTTGYSIDTESFVNGYMVSGLDVISSATVLSL